MFYSLDEVIGAIVVDSEGLVYGRVTGYKISAGRLLLEVSVELAGKPHPKGVVEVEEIAGLSVKYCLTPRGFEKTGVLLLKTRREAEYRGLNSVGFKLTKESDILGKLVVSEKGRVLGVVKSLLIGPGTMGIRVAGCSERGWVNWLGFIKELKARGRVAEADKLSELLDPYSKSKVPLSDYSSIRAFIEKVNPGLVDVLSTFIELERASSLDISWDKIMKVGDVVIVRMVD